MQQAFDAWPHVLLKRKLSNNVFTNVGKIMSYDQSYSLKEKNLVDDFKKQFNARIDESREYQEYAQTRYSEYSAMDYYNQRTVKPMIAIHLPKEYFENLLDQHDKFQRWQITIKEADAIIYAERVEALVRSRNSAAQLAYDQYKMILALTR